MTLSELMQLLSTAKAPDSINIGELEVIILYVPVGIYEDQTPHIRVESRVILELPRLFIPPPERPEIRHHHNRHRDGKPRTDRPFPPPT